MSYVDDMGYLRDSYGKLIHRKIAFQKIYQKNRRDYSLPFKEYIIHHRDGDKLNNKISNLQIMTQEEHQREHGLLEENDEEQFEQTTLIEPKEEPKKKEEYVEIPFYSEQIQIPSDLTKRGLSKVFFFLVILVIVVGGLLALDGETLDSETPSKVELSNHYSYSKELYTYFQGHSFSSGETKEKIRNFYMQKRWGDNPYRVSGRDIIIVFGDIKDYDRHRIELRFSDYVEENSNTYLSGGKLIHEGRVIQEWTLEEGKTIIIG